VYFLHQPYFYLVAVQKLFFTFVTIKNEQKYMKAFFYHALKIDHKRCIGCAHCVKNCPTEAIRVKEGKATIYENRCIDCGECYKVCPSGAIFVAQDDFENIYKYQERVLLVPSVFLGQFQEYIKASQVYSILISLGFTHIIEVETAAPIHCSARNNYAAKHKDSRPLISAFCPAIVRLIQVKFPSLVNNLVATKAPVDFAADYIRKKLQEENKDLKPDNVGLFYVTPCAAKIAAVKSPVGEEKSSVDGVINMDFMYNKVYKEIKQKHTEQNHKISANDVTSDSVMYSLTNGEKRTALCKKSYAIDEIKNVTEFLEKVEDEEVTGVDFLELRACDQGCPGGILTCGNRFLIRERIMMRAKQLANRERNGEIDRNKDINNYKESLLENMNVGEILPRSMMVLDENINVALEKLNTIRDIMTRLPQTDCCVCGAPSCRALAEDIVCGNADLTDCVFIQRSFESLGSMKSEESVNIMKKIWGKGKFLVLFFVSFLFSFNILAQNVTINGQGYGIKGKEIRLYSTEDAISNFEKEISKYNVEDSLFHFAVTLGDVTPLTIKIDNYQYTFWAQPGTIYNLVIHPFNYNIADSLNFYSHKFILPIEIIADSNELNHKIVSFDTQFETFVLTHIFQNVNNRAIIDSLNAFALQFADSTDTSYFATYVRYEIYQLMYSLGLYNRNKFKVQIFMDKPICYSNIGYMDCFNLVFEDYIAYGNKNMSPRIVERWLANQQMSIMLDSLGIDSVLRNEVFRELVFLKGMRDAFFTKGVEQTNIIKMLDVFIAKTKFDRHKEIAKNIKSYFKTYSKGEKIEDYVLKNVNEENVKLLSVFGEKPVILAFIKVKDVISRRELETIHQLYDDLQDSVKVVVICFDQSLDAMYNFIRNTKTGIRYKFPVLYFNQNWDMFDKFHIRDFPTFMFIDKDGNIIENRLMKPSDTERMFDISTGQEFSAWQRFIKQKNAK
jgi:iron only hydrogenase large subunit-like protein